MWIYTLRNVRTSLSREKLTSFETDCFKTRRTPTVDSIPRGFRNAAYYRSPRNEFRNRRAETARAPPRDSRRACQLTEATITGKFAGGQTADIYGRSNHQGERARIL